MNLTQLAWKLLIDWWLLSSAGQLLVFGAETGAARSRPRDRTVPGAGREDEGSVAARGGREWWVSLVKRQDSDVFYDLLICTPG
jgi:hypothetical protein